MYVILYALHSINEVVNFKTEILLLSGLIYKKTCPT